MTLESDALLITGAGRGLGRALAQHYLDKGCRVVGCARSDASIEHRGYSHFRLDIADEAAVIAMFKQIAADKQRIRVLVNNAGVAQTGLAVLTGGRGAEELIRTNLLGTFLVTREALKHMVRNKHGRVINFSSINVPLASAGSCLYNACKAGVDAMAKSLTRECARVDVTINSIGLSLVADTGMVGGLSAQAAADKASHLPKPSQLLVEEVAHAIDFFRAPLARNISGQTLFFGGV